VEGVLLAAPGIQSVLPDVDKALAGKSHLPAFSTTTAHYIKSVEAAATRAVDKISELFDNANGFGRPNQPRGRDEFVATSHEGVASKLGLHPCDYVNRMKNEMTGISVSYDS
jgi:hypothetical protein